MKVTIGDNLYIVKFMHFLEKPNSKSKKRFSTHCDIFNKDKELIISKDSRLNPIDKLNRNLGKAKALEHALSNFSKSERKLFWTEFHKNFKL